MSWDFLILGSSGIQGKITARALLEKGYTTFLTDLYLDGSSEIIKRYLTQAAFKTLDVRNVKNVVDLIKQIRPKVVINCAEGDYNLEVYEACLRSMVNVIDLGSDIEPTKKQLKLHDNFVRAGITGITGCGSTPGINNIMLRYASRDFDSVHTVELGFAWNSYPKEFFPPFSIGSIVYELIFPASYIENGIWKKINPLDSLTTRNFDRIGKQECFIVDHPEIYSFHNFLTKKGLKNIRFYAGFPKHSIDVIKTLIKLDLSGEKDVLVENDGDMVEVSPLDVLTQVLKRIILPKGYREKENLWVSIEGFKKSKPIRILMECLVETLQGWEEAGSNIDTGIIAAIIGEMIYTGEIKKYGSFVPEQIIPEEAFFRKIQNYGMQIYKNGIEVKFSSVKSLKKDSSYSLTH